MLAHHAADNDAHRAARGHAGAYETRRQAALRRRQSVGDDGGDGGLHRVQGDGRYDPGDDDPRQRGRVRHKGQAPPADERTGDGRGDGAEDRGDRKDGRQRRGLRAADEQLDLVGQEDGENGGVKRQQAK